MINGFEKQTRDLTSEELRALPVLIDGFKKLKGKKQAMTAKSISIQMKIHHNMSISGPRMRKLINFIRINDKVLFLIATSKGYCVADTEKEIIDYVISLKDRADSITHVVDCLIEQMKNNENLLK